MIMIVRCLISSPVPSSLMFAVTLKKIKGFDEHVKNTNSWKTCDI